MDAPLALVSTDQQLTAEPQPLPKELRDDIRRGLALLQRLGQRATGAIWPLWFWPMGFCSQQALTNVGATSAANVLSAFFPSLG